MELVLHYYIEYIHVEGVHLVCLTKAYSNVLYKFQHCIQLHLLQLLGGYRTYLV